jgi:deoxynucleoside kinase
MRLARLARLYWPGTRSICRGLKITGTQLGHPVMSSPIRVSIDGSIGVGKSSAICSAIASSGIPYHLEPVEQWTPLLKLMYEDPCRWAMALNLSVLLTMNRNAAQDDASQHRVVVYERSPLSCRYVFSELQHEMGYMTDEELAIVDEAFQQTAWIPDVLVYIRTSPEVAFQRIRHRDRRCEECLDMAYMQRLGRKYEAFVEGLRHRHPQTRVLVVDGNQDPDDVKAEITSALGTCDILRVNT